VALGFGRFPVGGPATFSDDWWTPRFTPTFHLHQGNDIFAAEARRCGLRPTASCASRTKPSGDSPTT